MKVEDLCDALQDIDEKYILEARGLEQAEELEGFRATGHMTRKKTVLRSVLKWCAAAAILILLVWGGSAILRPTSPVEDLDLPMIAIVENTADGMGYEGFWAYSFDEYKNENPRSEDVEIEYLPVYKNPWELDNMFASPIRDVEAMEKELFRIAEMLGIDTDTAEIERDPGAGDADSHLTFTIKTDKVWIDVDEVMQVTISFRETIEIPGVEPSEDYHTKYEDYVIAAEFILEEYGELLDMEDPQIEVRGGSRDIYADQSWYIVIYEGAGETIEERLVNYFFNNVRFSLSYGKLSYIHGDEVTKVEKIADYPIITLEEAKEKLAKGEYLTSVPYDMPGMEYVAGVELVYDTKILQDYYVPYYKFYVQELDLGNESLEELGLKGYNVYYVPAVEDKYLKYTENWYSGF
ncbi:MAG: hypothetical protein IJW63_06810 [Lachnospiraceae bacterium]|nr:hypothetical protein [Lachnospiraceae bacterium]